MPNSKEYLLIVDDEPEVLEFLADELSSENREVLTACSAEDAMENFLKPQSFSKQPLDFLLSDFQMAGLSGLELLLGLNFRYKDLGFAFLTGYAQRFRMLVAMNYGAFDFMEKPYNISSIQNMVAEGIRRTKWTKAIHEQVDQLALELELFPNTKARFERKARFTLRLLNDDFDLTQMRGWFEEGAHSSAGGYRQAVNRLFELFLKSASSTCLNAAAGYEQCSIEEKFQRLRHCYLSCRDMKFAAMSLSLEDLGNTFSWLSECALGMRVLPRELNAENEELLNGALESLGNQLKGLEGIKDSHDWSLEGRVDKLKILHESCVSQLFTI